MTTLFVPLLAKLHRQKPTDGAASGNRHVQVGPHCSHECPPDRASPFAPPKNRLRLWRHHALIFSTIQVVSKKIVIFYNQ
jgi:hypothetical protein